MKEGIKFKLIILLLVFIFVFALSGQVLNSQEQFTKIFESGEDFKLYYYLTGNVVSFKIESKTLGFVAIGFDPSSYMKDADMIIAYVKDGIVSIIDAYSTGNFGPHPEDTTLGGKNNILSFKGSESQGVTSIEFSRNLDTKDKYDKVITLDKEIKIIWAISSSDNFDTKHSKRGSGVITLKSSDSTTQPTPSKTVLKLIIGSRKMLVNDKEVLIDVAPIITEGRTLLPIRWVSEPLGAQVAWDSTERKVTVTLKETKIELWIGKSIAKVNGINTQIDAQNSKVVPVIVDSRTMLPVRFVSENLGCDVGWDDKTKTVTITYPKQ